MILLKSIDENYKIEQLVYNFIKNCNYKYVAFSDVYKFIQLNKLRVIKEHNFHNNTYLELTNIINKLVEDKKIKHENDRMVNHYYV